VVAKGPPARAEAASGEWRRRHHPRRKQLVVPESGDLAELSPARLYALLALTSGSGALQLELDKARMLQISFRRGAPEHLSCDDLELSLLRFLQSKGMIEADKALAAEEQAATSGQDIVSVLFQMQVIPAADAHRLLGSTPSSFWIVRSPPGGERSRSTRMRRCRRARSRSGRVGRCWWIPSGASTRRCSGRGSEKSCSARWCVRADWPWAR